MRLSICIATFKRADTIAETLRSIEAQLPHAVEVVILDGGSPDNTASVVAPFVARNPSIRYIREPTNCGIDADFDKAIQQARGEYVWLFTDDDLLVDNAVRIVLDQLDDGAPDLLVVDAEVSDLRLCRIFEAHRLPFTGCREYGPDQGDAFMRDAGNALSFIGGTIMRRDLWLARDRERYYGSLFVHVGVVFQAPIKKVRVLGQPLVRIRIGNAMWGPRAFEIWMFLWPKLIWGFAGYSNSAKETVISREPWRVPLELLNYRALGSLKSDHVAWMKREGASLLLIVYARILLAIPGSLAHIAMSMRVGLGKVRQGSHAYTLAVASPFSNPISRTIARLNGHRLGASSIEWGGG